MAFTRPIFILAACTALLSSVHAADIVISAKGASAGKQSISLAAMTSDQSNEAREFLQVLKGDLIRSGWFAPVDTPSASVVLNGAVRSSGGGVSSGATVKWLNGMRQFSWQQSVPSAQIRDAAHDLCDQIVTTVTGNKSMASSKILLVGRRGRNPEVYQCDADGARLKQLTSDNKLCLSPTWIPNRNAFLYTSWLNGTPAVYRVDLNTNRREPLANYPGMNNGAVVAPSGSIMALVLSRSGGVDLYVQNLSTRQLTRLTSSNKINESSPTWSPDGNDLAYISDEGRIPRLYVMDAHSRQGRRAIYHSAITECAAPEWGDNGLIAFCGRSGGRYRIYTINPAGDARTTVPTLVSPNDGADYEDPSWAPDERHIVCTRTANFKRSLVVLDTMGDPPQPLITVSGDWYLPHWSKNRPTR
ncbi:MAG: hypothetical protein ACOX9C_01355 [Kiritimatiellia bacterium]|jgi:TolB protein